MLKNAAVIAIVFLFAAPTPLASRDTCDIEAIYEMDTDVPEMKILTKDGEIVDLSDVVEAVLVPARLKAGSYEVEVTRKGQNVYSVKGEDWIIKTRYCHEYAHGKEATLYYRAAYGYSKGTLAFRD